MARHPILLAAILGAVLVTAGLVASNMVFSFGNSPALSGHGLVALVVGAFGMLALAVLLMGLVFYSSRSGHDQDAHDSQTAIATSEEAENLNAERPKN